MTLAGVLRIRQIRCSEQVEDNVAAIVGAKPLISYDKVITMNWDWEKLKEQQQESRGIPPQVDEFFKQFKKFKFPGGLLMVLILSALFFGSSVVYTVKKESRI